MYDTLVVSGGSSKGIVTLGALQSAYDAGHLDSITNFIGTSAGAMSCFLIAIGYQPIDVFIRISTSKILERMKCIDIHSLINLHGGLPFSIIGDEIDSMTIEKIGYIPTLAQLKHDFGKTLICATYNKTERRLVYCGPDTTPDLFCTTAIRMSSSLPLIFEPCVYNNCTYIDGGVCDNFPIDIGKSMTNSRVLGFVLGGARRGKLPGEPENILEYLYDLLFIPTEQYLLQKMANTKDKCNIISLNCNLTFYSFDLSMVTVFDLFSDGYSQYKSSLCEAGRQSPVPLEA